MHAQICVCVCGCMYVFLLLLGPVLYRSLVNVRICARICVHMPEKYKENTHTFSASRSARPGPSLLHIYKYS
jgi:hypothetical protein